MPAFDETKFINPAQVGGIESYGIDEGPARGVRALCVNTGGGLRYRVLLDRGADIDQAFFNQHSLTFLSHKGPTAPTRGLDRGLDWLKGFGGGLLTSCGPFNIGSPCTDNGEELGLHGPHSNTSATLESITQLDPRRGNLDMRIVVSLRYGQFYGPCVELRRTISSRLGENAIDFVDQFFNAGSTSVPHAWLLHINFGYPLLDEGAEFCYRARKVEPMGNHAPSAKYFRAGRNFKRVPKPLKEHSGDSSVVGYIYPRPIDRAGRTIVGVVNRKLALGVAIHYSTKEFRRCVNWQHWGGGEYVSALEPANGSVEGRDVDRKNGELDSLKPGERKAYHYRIGTLSTPNSIRALMDLNSK
jgi:hypothetical protein